MTTMRRDRLVDDYLRRLEAAAAHLPRERRRELMGEIEEHVEAGLAEAGDAPPERGRLETAALIVLCFSFLLPLVGYLLGAGLVLASKAWRERDKLIGLVLAPAAVLAAAEGAEVAGERGGVHRAAR